MLQRLSDLVNIARRRVAAARRLVPHDADAWTTARKLASQVDYPKGSIQNPMNDEELRAKFDSLVHPGARRRPRDRDRRDGA